MRRILTCFDETPQVQQAVLDYKEASVNAIIKQIPAVTTLTELAKLMGYSHEWVRERLVKNPEYAKHLYRINRRYKIPYGIAVKFVKSVFGP